MVRMSGFRGLSSAGSRCGANRSLHAIGEQNPDKPLFSDFFSSPLGDRLRPDSSKIGLSMAPLTELSPQFSCRPAQGHSGSGRRLPVFRCDVLVLGSGSAGLSAALSAAQQGRHVMVVAKDSLDETNTRVAQGGVAAAVGVQDCPEHHAADTLAVGGGLCEAAVVHALVERAPAAIHQLLDWGMNFDRAESGELDLGQEGGHRLPRILHSGGTATGLELQRVLLAVATAHPNLDFFDHTVGVDLLHDQDGRIRGLLALTGPNQDPVLFEAGAVLLATGGGGQIFRETTNPDAATADGLALGLRAGAVLQDLEFVQFHPTILYLAGAARFLISEVVRGAGGRLLDRHGKCVMTSVHPDGELAPRDVVSRAIFRRMVETGDTHLYLDCSEIPRVSGRFPLLARISSEFGIDLTTEPLPVRPAVHYLIGGLAVDLDGQSSLPGLWATGECASTGFHGANRMGSNSLLEGLVHGTLAGTNAGLECQPRHCPIVMPSASPEFSGHVKLNLADMTYSLKSLMWRQVGIERSGAGLEDALLRLSRWESYLARADCNNREALEVVNMVQVAQALTWSALAREESRGAHYRQDYPTPNGGTPVHSRVILAEEGLQHSFREVGSVCPAPPAHSA